MYRFDGKKKTTLLELTIAIKVPVGFEIAQARYASTRDVNIVD